MRSGRPGALRPSPSDSYCPYKGTASYYGVVLPDGKELEDAAWTYRAPYSAVDAIAGRVAFYTDRVQVNVETRAGQLRSNARRTLPRPVAFWLVAAASGTVTAASSAPSPLYPVYQVQSDSPRSP